MKHGIHNGMRAELKQLLGYPQQKQQCKAVEMNPHLGADCNQEDGAEVWLSSSGWLHDDKIGDVFGSATKCVLFSNITVVR